MKKKLHLKSFLNFAVIMLFLSISLNAQQIVYVFDPARTDENGVNPDKPIRDILTFEGYEVIPFITPDISQATDEQIDTLENADLIYIGRAVASVNFQGDNRFVWHGFTAPMITSNMWALRSNRMNWFNTETCTNVDDPVDAVFMGDIWVDDPVFEGLMGTLDWWTGPYSTIEITYEDAGNGEVLATKTDGGQVLFVRFEADIEFYPGGDIPYGPRVYIGSASDNMRDENQNPIYNYWGYTDEIKQVFLNEVASLLGLFPSGIENSELKLNPSVYPVPATNNLVVEMENLNSLDILDPAGRCISSYTVNSKEITLDVSGLKSGIYILKISDKKGNALMKKFIKE